MFDQPAFYLILVASLCLLLLLISWPIITHNKVSKTITMILKITLIVSVLLLIFIELAIVDFAGMAFGPEVMYHFSLDAFILGSREYKYILVLLFIVIGLLTWFMLSAVHIFNKRLQWVIFVFSLLGYILLGHYTVVGRLYKAAKDYYSQNQIKSMSAEELEKYAYLGIQPIITDKDNIEIKSTKHKNLIVIYLESFSQVFTESRKYPNLTPNLNKFKQQYQPIDPYISSASFTMDGLITSMCGFIPDMRMGNNTLASQQGTYSALPCFPDVLQKAGYNQEFFGGAKKQFAGKAAFLFAHGFDRVVGWEDFVDLPEYQAKESHNWWGLNDDDLFDKVFSRVNELHKQERPFHTQVLTIGTHLKGFSSPSCESYTDRSHRYIDAIHCTDQLVGQFIKRLDEAGILEDTVVYITGDHGVFKSDLSQELFGKEVADRNLYGVIINKNPISTVHIESLYDLAPAVLKSAGVEHNVQFVLGRDYQINDRMVFTRHSIYKNGEPVDIEYQCNEQTTLQQKIVTACSVKSALNAVKAHTQLFSSSEGVVLTVESKLVIGYEKDLTGIGSIKLDGIDLKSHFKRDGFAVQEKYFKRPGLFYMGFNKNSRTADNFILIRADKNPSDILRKLRDDFRQDFIIFGARNSENQTILDSLRHEYALNCLFGLICFSQMMDIAFDNAYDTDRSTVVIGIKSLLSHADKTK